jgi:enamine deaminase RidA (YjgF/YER057c/UK114 family)
VTREVVVSDTLSRPGAQFSHAVAVGSVVVVGAKGATKRKGNPPWGPALAEVAEEQALVMFRNLAMSLAELGASEREVVQTTGFLTDWRYQACFRAAFDRFFGEERPALTLVFSPAFALAELLMQIDAICFQGQSLEHIDSGGVVAGVRAGDQFYSSMITASPRTGRRSAFGEDFRRAWDLATEALDRAGLAPGDLLRVRAFLADPRDMAEFQSIWQSLLPAPRPSLVVMMSSHAVLQCRLALDLVADQRPINHISWEAVGLRDERLAGESAAAVAGTMVFTASIPSPFANGQGAGALDALADVLSVAGARFTDVLRLEGVVDDWRRYARFNESYSRVVESPYPARSLIQGSPAAYGEPIQLSAIADLRASNSARVLVATAEEAAR